MRCIPLPLAASAGLFALVSCPSLTAASPEEAAREDASPATLAPGGRLETQMIPELGQTIFYVRFPDAVDGTAILELSDSAGGLHAISEVEISGGTGLVVWDGHDESGEILPSDLYLARLRFAGVELTAPLVR